MRKWTLVATLVLVIGGMLEVTAWAGLRALGRWRSIRYVPLAATTVPAEHRRILERLLAGETTYLSYSETLGWSLLPGGSSGPYRANAQGLRADREYAAAPGPDTVRIAAFGDSFTHGDHVARDETWGALLEAAVPGTEVLNFGVFGYGLDQALLRWEETGRHFGPHVVLIGYLTENIGRHVNTYRPFYGPGTGQPLAKPRFVQRGDGELELVGNPAGSLDDYRALLEDPATVLRRFGAGDYYYTHTPHASRWDRSALVRLLRLARHELVDLPSHPIRDGVYNTDSEAYAVTIALFDRFVASVRAEGAAPLIVVFPTRVDLRRRERGEPQAYAPLLAALEARGYDVVDVLEGIPRCGSGCDLDTIIPGHFAPAGHRVVAGIVARAVQQRVAAGRTSAVR